MPNSSHNKQQARRRTNLINLLPHSPGMQDHVTVDGGYVAASSKHLNMWSWTSTCTICGTDNKRYLPFAFATTCHTPSSFLRTGQRELVVLGHWMAFVVVIIIRSHQISSKQLGLVRYRQIVKPLHDLGSINSPNQTHHHQYLH